MEAIREIEIDHATLEFIRGNGNTRTSKRKKSARESTRKKRRLWPKERFHPCGKCFNGLVIVEHDGHRQAERCECKKVWRRSCNAPSEATVERARVQGQ